MKIGIDARFYNEAGPGRYVKNLISELEKIDHENSYFIFLKESNFNSYWPLNPNFSKVKADYPWYSLKEQIFFPVRIWGIGVNLMHFTQFNIPVLWPGPFVVTIHDMIMHEYSTARDTTRSGWTYKIKKLAYLIVFWLACRRARHIIVPSRATGEDLMNKLRVEREKISITYEGVGEAEHNPAPLSEGNPTGVEKVKDQEEEDLRRLQKYGVIQPFLLYVGSMYPHKNLDRLLSAFKLLISQFNFNGQLVIIGKESDFSRRLSRLVTEKHLSSRIIFPGKYVADGYLPDREVSTFYRRAELFVFPSLKEGFGLPPLEAMSLGIPVVASNISCIPEVCSNAAHYFNPFSTEDIAARINEVLNDSRLRRDLIAAGYQRVKNFSWKNMAEQTLSIYRGL